MLKIQVKRRRILGENKEDNKIFYPIIIWIILSLTLFLLFGIVNDYFLIPFFICFLCIIPIAIMFFKKMDEYKGEKSFYITNIEFNIKDNKLYANEFEITNIIYERKKNIFHVNDTHLIKTKVKGVKYDTPVSSFVGIIEENNVSEFKKFLEKNNINMKKYNKYIRESVHNNW